MLSIVFGLFIMNIVNDYTRYTGA